MYVTYFFVRSCVLVSLSGKFLYSNIAEEEIKVNHQLIKAISNFFAASNGTDTPCIRNCFTQDAVVHDEGSVHRGHAAIQSWLQETQKKFEYSVEPISSSGKGEHVTVIAEVTGNFPGSPIQLRHLFQLKGSKIQSLEIS